MKTKSIATRRRFFLQASAALAAPIAAVHAAQDDDGATANARLATLEDVNAIRELERTFARLVNSGAHEKARELFAASWAAEIDTSIRRFSTDGLGELGGVEISTDRQTATARTRCTVETETAIGPNCTLVEMARLQGEGVLRRAEKRVLVSTYVKQDKAWKIAGIAFEPA
jgi:hypothetical protein